LGRFVLLRIITSRIFGISRRQFYTADERTARHNSP
jgi:hypothetical protein